MTHARKVPRPYLEDCDYLFDGHHAERVANLLNAFDISAVVNEFEPGKFEVRIDPADPTVERGWVAVAGQDNATLGWYAIRTELDSEVFPHTLTGHEYVTTPHTVPLCLPANAEPSQVAIALMSLLASGE